MKQARPERPAGDKTNHISRKVLVLERDPFMRQALSQRLHAERYTVLMAATASEAIKAICEQKPDLILLDLGMPERTAHGRGVSWDEFLVISWRGALRPGCCIPFIALSDA